jgi:hypothetical protein
VAVTLEMVQERDDERSVDVRDVQRGRGLAGAL